MYKFLTVGLLVLSSHSVFAMDEIAMALDISMKSIVRTKLWYEGIDPPKKAKSYSRKNADLPDGAAEELVIAIEKFEQI